MISNLKFLISKLPTERNFWTVFTIWKNDEAHQNLKIFVKPTHDSFHSAFIKKNVRNSSIKFKLINYNTFIRFKWKKKKQWRWGLNTSALPPKREITTTGFTLVWVDTFQCSLSTVTNYFGWKEIEGTIIVRHGWVFTVF